MKFWASRFLNFAGMFCLGVWLMRNEAFVTKGSLTAYLGLAATVTLCAVLFSILYKKLSDTKASTKVKWLHNFDMDTLARRTWDESIAIVWIAGLTIGATTIMFINSLILR